MAAYYNENEPYAAEWLRNLIREGLIADGDVDDRSIAEVVPPDLDDYQQCHFFAGIGGWSAALRLAGVADDTPLWTGSCPCQPFSVAGKQEGFADARHLWPEWSRLIAQCRPAVVLGEQVASAAKWLGLVRSDLEALGYAVGCIPVEAASAGAYHLRDRYWFVADRERPRLAQRDRNGGIQCKALESSARQDIADACNSFGAVADADQPGAWVLGADGKARRVESSVCCLVNGVWCGLAGLRAGLVHQAAKEMRNYVEKSNRSTGEILYMVQNAFEQKTLQWTVGVCGELHEKEILLAFLLDVASACNQSADDSRLAKTSGFDEKGAMRSLRIADIDLGASCKRRSDGQLTTEFTDPLFSLSWVLACHVETYRKLSDAADAKALPLLSSGETNRVAKLRAFGNAIDLRPAAAFVKAAIGG